MSYLNRAELRGGALPRLQEADSIFCFSTSEILWKGAERAFQTGKLQGHVSCDRRHECGAIPEEGMEIDIMS